MGCRASLYDAFGDDGGELRAGALPCSRLDAGRPAPIRALPLTGMRLSEPLPQERLTPIAQLLVRALDLPEELDEVLVTRLLGVLEVVPHVSAPGGRDRGRWMTL